MQEASKHISEMKKKDQSQSALSAIVGEILNQDGQPKDQAQQEKKGPKTLGGMSVMG